MDLATIAVLHDVLAPGGWLERTRRLGATLRRAPREPGGLLLVGTPTSEPWHLAAHLDDEARLSGVAEISPTLVRWRPPADAPAHLAVGLDRLTAARRGEAVFVVAPETAPSVLLERVSDARRTGATVLALDAGDPDLEGLAHEWLTVPGSGLSPAAAVAQPAEEPAAEPHSRIDLTAAGVPFEVVSHLVSAAAGESARTPSVRARLNRLLDRLSGPVLDDDAWRR